MKTTTELSLTSAAVAFGVSRETVRRALARADIKTPEGATFTIRQIHLALAGNISGERARLLRAQADRAELENRVRRGELEEKAGLVEGIWNRILLPFRTDLLELARRHGLEKPMAQLLEKHNEIHKK